MNVLTTVLGYALSSVFALERSMPAGGLGKTKKEILMNGVETILKATVLETGTLAAGGSNVGTNTAIKTITEAVSGFVDATVDSLKKSKVFAPAAPAS